MTNYTAEFRAALRRKIPELLVRVVEEDRIDRAVGKNVRIELDRCSSRQFAERFAQACPVAGCGPKDYLQRILEPRGAWCLLAGIRFLSHPDFPYVDIVASTEPLEDAAALTEAVAVVYEEFAEFRPRAVRLLRRVGNPPKVTDGFEASVDQYVVAGHLDSLSRRPPVARQEVVRLVPAYDPDEAAEFVERSYEVFFDEHPDFRQIVVPADRDDLESCREGGAVVYVQVDGHRAGLLAADHTLGPLVEGQTVVEEILVSRFRNRGLAPAAQRRFIDYLADDHPDSVLRGTIDDRNRASLATAQKTGRQIVAAYHWIRRSE